MADSFFKKENNKKKTLIKKQKAQKRQDRKTSNNKGKGFESMIVYVDANGHFTNTPPEKQLPEDADKKSIPGQRIQRFQQNERNAK
ncbi:hypothetical protein ACLI1A_19285 [Flavobacterium sp. RHBU_3]|uniref:hypothetical protein n=1 Tax=Flavobacterium sp. RHBU_3 TaxID=3391184 RepID=UPI0039856311